MAGNVEGKHEIAAQEAAEWHLRLSDSTLSRDERLQYLRWLRASPMHVAEALRIRTVDVLLFSTRLDGDESKEIRTPSTRLDRLSRRKMGAPLVALVLMLSLVMIVLIAGMARSSRDRDHRLSPSQFPLKDQSN